ncbi:MAG: type I-A CRISPR-associated protein Cas4/Csa1 [Desulfurococcaceae archaeon]
MVGEELPAIRLLGRRHLLRAIRRLYSWSRSDPVDEELRGWNWDRPPLKPRAYYELGVSEIASKYCGTRRDVWLRRVAGARGEATELLARGKAVHEAIALAYREVARWSALGTEPWDIYERARGSWKRAIGGLDAGTAALVERVYKYTLLSLVGEMVNEEVVHGERQPPLAVSEVKVDGSSLGLSSSLSVDLLEGGVIVDFKYGAPRDFHKLSVAGYALALEAEYEVPYDFGVLVYVTEWNGRLKAHARPIYVNSYLRRWFVDERDAIIDMLVEGREPPRDAQCNPACPFRRVCAP